MRRYIFLLFLTAGILTARPAHIRSINVPAIEGDATPALQQAINEAAGYGGKPVVIQLQNADYHLYRSSSTERPYHVSNTTTEKENPDVTKHIGLWMKGLRNVTLSGRGARLITHGEMTAFVIDSCRNIRLTGFTLNAADPTVPEMTVTETGENEMTVSIHPQTRYSIRDGRLWFEGDSWAWSTGIAQIYDPERDITWRSWMPLNDQLKAEQLGPGRVRLSFREMPVVKPGYVFQMRDSYRDEVCGLIQYSRDVSLDNLHVAFAGNFSIVAQMTENLTYRHLTLEPEPGSGRTCAGFADFLHFSGCAGRVLVEDSRFVGSQDDPINVHGTHLSVREFTSPTELRVRYMHGQTFGFQSFLPGNQVDFVDAHTLLPLGTFRVREARMLNPREIMVRLTRPVPQTIRDNPELVLENVTFTPEVVVRNNYFARVPTRGILVSTRRAVLIEGNLFFRTQHSGILIADDARSWYESGMVRDVTIRDNRFVECGSPAILIAPENDRNAGCVHRGICIENNHFRLSGGKAVSARSVDGLRIQGNTITGPSDGEPIQVRDCENVQALP